MSNTMKRCVLPLLGILTSIGFMTTCDPDVAEPARVCLPLQTDLAGLEACMTDLGWTVTLSTARVAVWDFEFTIEGEAHACRINGLWDWLVPAAHAHPDHFGGGDVTGELRGPYLLDFLAPVPQVIGRATLLEGDYQGVNFYFRTTSSEDGLAATDPLLGHTAVLQGTASRDDQSIDFHAQIRVEEGLQMVGGPFHLSILTHTQARLQLQLYTQDPVEGDTLFDGIDFAALDVNGNGQVHIAPGSVAHNRLMKTLITHDHWGVTSTILE